MYKRAKHIYVLIIICFLVYIVWNLLRTLPSEEGSITSLSVENLFSPVIAKPYLLGRNICWNDKLFLVVVVCSSVGNFEARKAVRKTWGSRLMSEAEKTNKSVKVVFLVGMAEQSLQSEITRENSLFHDLIQMEFLDTYENLTIKSMAMLHWVNYHCPNVKFLMKADDDIYVNYRRLIQLLQTIDDEYSGQQLAIGKLVCFAPPRRKTQSKYFTPKSVFPDKFYPNYLSGTGYILTGNLIYALYQTLLSCKYFHLEDIMVTGMGLLRLGIKPLNHPSFTTRVPKFRKCELENLITVHEVSPSNIILVHQNMQNSFCNRSRKFTTKIDDKCYINMLQSIFHFLGIYL